MSVWENFTNQKQWETYLKNLVKNNNKALLKSIVLIYESQTQEEKAKGESIEDNCVGFSKIDAYEMGQVAKKIKSGQPLTKGEIAKSRNKMQKYWKQLMIISKKKADAKKQARNEFEEILQEIALVIEKEKEEVEQQNEILRKCLEECTPCSYGICSECSIML